MPRTTPSAAPPIEQAPIAGSSEPSRIRATTWLFDVGNSGELHELTADGTDRALGWKSTEQAVR